MLAYIVRRFVWMIPITLGVMLLTFILFSVMAKDPARAFAGKFASEDELREIRHKMDLDTPRWMNIVGARQTGRWQELFNAQFFHILFFQFPESMHHQESVWSLFRRKAPVSFVIQLPIYVV